MLFLKLVCIRFCEHKNHFILNLLFYSSIFHAEYDYCSDRGTCNTNSGLCACYADFIANNCGAFTYGIRALDTLKVGDIMTLQNTRADFTGNILQLTSAFNGSQAFNFIQVTDTYRNFDSPIFNMDGYGNVRLNYGGLTISG